MKTILWLAVVVLGTGLMWSITNKDVLKSQNKLLTQQRDFYKAHADTLESQLDRSFELLAKYSHLVNRLLKLYVKETTGSLGSNPSMRGNPKDAIIRRLTPVPERKGEIRLVDS